MSNLKKVFVLLSILLISIVFVSCSMLSQDDNKSTGTTEEDSGSGSKFVINTGSTTKKPTTTTKKDDDNTNTDNNDDETTGGDTDTTGSDDTHTCSFTVSKYDDDYHWIACSHTGCDKYITKEAHSYTVTYVDKNTHASICSCGRKANTENHTLSYKQTTTGHYQECLGCNTHTQEEAHSASSWVETSAKSMYKKCETCSYTMETSVETSLNRQMKQALNSSVTDGDFKTSSSFGTAYINAATADFIIPGINQYFVVQAVDVWEAKSIMLISGYFSVGTKSITTVTSCSVIFAVNMSTGSLIGEYYVLNNGGADHSNHDGGIAVTSNNIYLAVGNKLHRISLDSLKDNKTGNYPSSSNYVSKYVEIKETISMPVKASYCNYSGGYIWVGDFLYKESGTTSYTQVPHDELTNSEDSSTNYGAWVVGYKVDETKPNQEIPSTPSCVFGVREKVQGITYDKDDHKFYMTTSYGRSNNSTLYSYSFNAFNGNSDSTVTINDTSVKFWFLDSTYSEKSYTIPPMAECPTITKIYDEDGSTYTKLYIPFESSSKLYSEGLDDKGTCSFVQQRIHAVDVDYLT